jgi:hypothetical protein
VPEPEYLLDEVALDERRIPLERLDQGREATYFGMLLHPVSELTRGLRPDGGEGIVGRATEQQRVGEANLVLARDLLLAALDLPMFGPMLASADIGAVMIASPTGIGPVLSLVAGCRDRAGGLSDHLVLCSCPAPLVAGFLEALGDRSLLRVVRRRGLLGAVGGRGPAGQQTQGIF